MRIYSKVILPILLLHAAAAVVCADPMGTAFNYQGYLTFNGKAADGQYDIQFKLFDVPNNGNARGTVTYAPADVNKGLFTTNIDFGGVFDGNAYWLEIGVRPYINNPPSYEWKPRLQIRPVPYALFASNAATATTATTAITANGVSANAVSGAGIQNNSITANKIASGQVVKSLNGLFDNVTLAAGANVALTPNGNTLTIAASGGGSSGWSLTGNSGTTSGQNFLGTTDNQPLELKVNNVRALHLENVGSFFGGYSMNWIGGHNVNHVSNGAIGATIAGGGFFNPNLGGDSPNVVGANFGTVGGGAFNSVGGPYGTIPGGFGNQANGEGSFAAGELARANHNGSFVWGDGSGGAFSTAVGSFDVLCTGGANFHTGANPLTLYGPWLVARGLGDEQAYLGGDGAGGDVQIGSLSPTVGTIACYNAANNTYMDMVVRTLTILGGGDLAEPFPMADANIPEGSVVIIDEENPGQLKLSSEPYDTRVAGIVSGAGGIHPGVSLRQQGKLDAGQNVALSGRVYVLADASKGAIKPGDLLTTSSTAGHAMKVSDHARAQGAILGKAMSGLKEGKGLVLVLVTLQ